MINPEVNLTNKSFHSSLSTILRLLPKSIAVTMAKIVVSNNSNFFIIENQSAGQYRFNITEEALQEDINKGEIFISEKFPSTEFSEEINCYASIPLITTTGKRLGILIVFDTKTYSFTDQDISTLKDFAQIIVNTIEKHFENEKTQQVFIDFLHKTVHDLKNPLTSISLTSELLKRKAQDPKTVISFSDRLEKASQKLFANLENLKSAYPVENSGFKLQLTELNLKDLLEEIQKDISTADITIETTLTTNIHAEHYRLKEAITQLISHILLHDKVNRLKMKSYEKSDEVIIELSSEQTTITTSAALTIAKTLIGMHKGNVSVTDAGYLVSLPSTVL
jgi:signal transduction histidine kinase